jgi:site-specific recombinase XerD
MLNNGVLIEAVSRMLAHSSIRVTQLYAKVYDQHLIEQTKHISWLWGKDGA